MPHYRITRPCDYLPGTRGARDACARRPHYVRAPNLFEALQDVRARFAAYGLAADVPLDVHTCEGEHIACVTFERRDGGTWANVTEGEKTLAVRLEAEHANA